MHWTWRHEQTSSFTPIRKCKKLCQNYIDRFPNQRTIHPGRQQSRVHTNTLLCLLPLISSLVYDILRRSSSVSFKKKFTPSANALYILEVGEENKCAELNSGLGPNFQSVYAGPSVLESLGRVGDGTPICTSYTRGGRLYACVSSDWAPRFGKKILCI